MIDDKKIVQYVGANRACDLSGLSRPMLDYLSREGFIRPSGSGSLQRGKKRLYTFGDVVVLRIIGRLLTSGVEVKRLHFALRSLRPRASATGPGQFPFRFLVTNGKEILLRGPNGTFESLKYAKQLEFAFVVDVHHAEREIVAAGHRFGGWANNTKKSKATR